MDSILVRFLPTHDGPIVTMSIGDKLRGRPSWDLRKPTRLGGAHGYELPRHNHRLYLFCSLAYPNHLLCLYHIDHRVPSVLAVTTASLWT
jgi:hypothetical protein